MLVLRCGEGMGTTDVMARDEMRGKRRRGRGKEGGGDEENEAIELVRRAWARRRREHRHRVDRDDASAL